MKISARNVFEGKIENVEVGAVMANIKIESPELITAIITKESVEKLDLKKGDTVSYTIKTTVKDQEHSMYPYLGHVVKHRVDYLEIRVLARSNILNNVKHIVYADTQMDIKFSESSEVDYNKENDYDCYNISIKDPNLFYSYCLEWEFKNET